MDLIVKNFPHLNLKDNGICFLGEFNINLLQDRNYILNGKVAAACQRPLYTLISKYEFCQINYLK